MRGWLDYCMRRKGWFLLFLVIFAVSSYLGYQGLVAWRTLQAANDDSSTAQVEIEVPHTGATDTETKHPEDGLVSAYSGGKTTTTDNQAQVGTFPFDFGRDLRPGMSTTINEATPETESTTREVVRTVAKWVFAGSALALVLHVLADRYWR